jgi:hypothetical protein
LRASPIVTPLHFARRSIAYSRSGEQTRRAALWVCADQRKSRAFYVSCAISEGANRRESKQES